MTNLMHTRFILQYVHYNPLHVAIHTHTGSATAEKTVVTELTRQQWRHNQ